MITSVLFPRGRVWHFGNDVHTVCGKYHKGTKAIVRNRPASDGKICAKCTRWVGDEMMDEYLGLVWRDEPTMAEIRGSCPSSIRSEAK